MTIPDDIMKTAESLWGASTLDIARALVAERGAWQPIETAKKDRTVLLWGGELDDTMSFSKPWPMQEPTSAKWDGDRWIVGNAGGHDEYIIARDPTHWMPLPASPEAKP